MQFLEILVPVVGAQKVALSFKKNTSLLCCLKVFVIQFFSSPTYLALPKKRVKGGWLVEATRMKPSFTACTETAVHRMQIPPTHTSQYSFNVCMNMDLV